ncbi:MAG: hypothetical protein ACK40G_06800 [Cytophagaceae bacterium]
MKCRISLFLSGLILLALPAFAQPLDQPHNKEFIFGINFNTHGGLLGGANFRYARQKSAFQYEIFGLEVVNVKHLSEERTSSPVTGNAYIFGKTNYLVSFRPQYGRTFALFNKAPEEGVQVDAVFAAGPTIGLVKPYMIEYDYFTYSQVEAYDPERHVYSRILGNGPFMSGFDQAKIVPGIHCKAGLSLEFGPYMGNVSGIEIGGLLEAFPRRINLMNDQQGSVRNKAVFTSLYLTIYYGKRD